MQLSTSILLTIALAPLIGCLLAGFLGKQIGRVGAHSVTIDYLPAPKAPAEETTHAK